MKKVLVKAYTALNLGDDLFLKILVDRYPNTKFTLMTENEKGIYSLFSSFRIHSFCFHLFHRFLTIINKTLAEKYSKIIIERTLHKASRKYDAFVLLGGSMFIQNNKSYSEDDVVKMYCLQQFKHAFVIGANFGPYIDRDYLHQYKNIFSKCDYVSFRDKYSYDLFGGLYNSTYLPDIVFQLKHKKKKVISDSVGISVIDLSHRDDLSCYTEHYINFLISLVNQLVGQGKKVYLFSFCKRQGDEYAISQITQATDCKIPVIKYDGDIESFLESYSMMESMFCTRFHSMILSLIYSQNMVPLVYSRKMTQVLKDIDYNGKVIDLHSIDTVNVNTAISWLEENQFELPSYISIKSEEMFKQLDLYLR